MIWTDMARMVATTAIWAAIAVIAIVLGIASPDNLNFLSLAVLLGVGWFATSEVWEKAKPSNQTAHKREQAAERTLAEKPKRMPAETTWTEQLSDDELNALERALAARRAQMDEDQQIELKRLLAEQERDQRSS